MSLIRYLAVLTAMLLVFSTAGTAQKLMGLVVQKNTEGVDEPVPGANVYWMGTSTATTTGDNGIFMIDRLTGKKLIVSFTGLVSDTIDVTDEKNLKVELKSERYLEEVTIEGWQPASGLDHARGVNTVVMLEKELFKAACCNLSESFETNPSVDVAFTDAVTGTRQIQMLGLAGPNTLITIENMPGVRGLASSQGIQLIPGTWINSIEVTKGTGSVVNGYESIAGQINVEMKKPQESEKLYVNGYFNQSGRSEANVNYTAMIGKKWATTFLLHGSARPFEMDGNKDGFLDFPLGNQLNAVNRWVYNNGKGWLGQFGVKILRDDKQGGQKGFSPEDDKFSNNRYGLEINTDRIETWGKLGYQFPGKPYKSFGVQLSATRHEHDSYYGYNVHNGEQKSGYANFIYQSIISSTNHKFKAGLSFLYDSYQEEISNDVRPFVVVKDSEQQLLSTLNFDRTESVPGAFVEYTYDYLDKFTLIAGLRADYHNLFGTIVTPRLHTRWNLGDLTTLRMSAGKGTRVANVLVENTGALATSRQLVFSNLQSKHAYGFKPEEAWNYGLNLSRDFTLNYRTGSLTADYFYTDFRRQVVADYDHSAREVNFFALNGRSYSHSAQVQVDYQLARRFDVRMAYRYLDVNTDLLDKMRSRPLVSKHRTFINLAYATRNEWKFDFTAQWFGKQRIPDTSSNPAEYQLAEMSTPYTLLNAQVSKDLKRWSLYLGVENLGNFRLDDPIISAEDPFSDYFDSSLVWGPVFGRMVYTGFRYRIK